MQSIWMKDYKFNNFPIVDKNLNTQVLIIGGGIAGLMCAYNLMKNNIDFILVDRQNLASGVSAYTTAQVSIAHDALYDEISQKQGEEKAELYLKAQIEGLKIIKKIIKEEKIECDSKEESTILHSSTEKNIEILKSQFELIKTFAKNVRFLNFSDNIINFKNGIEFKNQLIINPVKFMQGIIDVLKRNKCEIYENSIVTEINKSSEKYEVVINDKYKIITNIIIMSAHYPFLNPDNLYFAKLFQSKSYAVAFKTKLKLNANYISLDEPFFYIRSYNNSTLIIGGSDHFSGINVDVEKCYEQLINKIYELDKNAKILGKWYTEDCMSIDSLPFVGRYSNMNPNIFLTTGFQKWGFTNAAIAGKNIVDLILGRNETCLCKTKRYTLLKDLKSTFRMMLHVIDGLVISKVFIKKYDIRNMDIGSGKVIRYKKNNVLVYRENENDFVFLENKCTHMGCALIWNNVDKVWESKCHGSIFDRYGHVIYGPAIKDLKVLNLK